MLFVVIESYSLNTYFEFIGTAITCLWIFLLSACICVNNKNSFFGNKNFDLLSNVILSEIN